MRKFVPGSIADHQPAIAWTGVVLTRTPCPVHAGSLSRAGVGASAKARARVTTRARVDVRARAGADSRSGLVAV
jgi:hypothetical protein